MINMATILDNYVKALKERNDLQVLLAQTREQLAAAEAVCERVDEMLVPSFDPKMDDLIARWMKLKETKEPKP